jgi:hypothetical protein
MREGRSVREFAEALGARWPERAVSIRWKNDLWPVEDWKAIQDARSRYEAGLCELAQGRVRDHFILYEFPRKTPAPRRSWFVRECWD